MKPIFPRQNLGRPRIHDQREILDAIFYVLRSGCAWRLMPHDFPPWQTAYYYFRYWKLKGIWHRLLKALHTAERLRAGRSPDPTARHYGQPKRQNYRRIVRIEGL